MEGRALLSEAATSIGDARPQNRTPFGGIVVRMKQEPCVVRFVFQSRILHMLLCACGRCMASAMRGDRRTKVRLAPISSALQSGRFTNSLPTAASPQAGFAGEQERGRRRAPCTRCRFSALPSASVPGRWFMRYNHHGRKGLHFRSSRSAPPPTWMQRMDRHPDT